MCACVGSCTWGACVSLIGTWTGQQRSWSSAWKRCEQPVFYGPGLARPMLPQSLQCHAGSTYVVFQQPELHVRCC